MKLHYKWGLKKIWLILKYYNKLKEILILLKPLGSQLVHVSMWGIIPMESDSNTLNIKSSAANNESSAANNENSANNNNI